MKDKFKALFSSIGYLFIAFLIQIVISLIGGIILGVLYGMTNPVESLYDADALTNYILSNTSYILLVSSIVTILVLILIYALKQRKIKNELLFQKTKTSNLITAFLLGFSVWCINFSGISLLSLTGSFQNAFESFSEVSNTITSGSIFSTILVVGFVAPFAEEFLFRGIIFRTLNRKFSMVSAIILQGIMFGIFHFNLVQGIYASFLGIVFGYITYKTKSIWPAIICHTTNNLVAITIPSLLTNINAYLAFFILMIIGLLLTTASLIFINKNTAIPASFAKDLKL